ncbi:Glutathione biosynthesis bifunctional protein GshAB, partial [Dissostichus eleginoides]
VIKTSWRTPGLGISSEEASRCVQQSGYWPSVLHTIIRSRNQAAGPTNNPPSLYQVHRTPH